MNIPTTVYVRVLQMYGVGCVVSLCVCRVGCLVMEAEAEWRVYWEDSEEVWEQG